MVFRRHFISGFDSVAILAGIYSRKKITNVNGNRVIDGGYENVSNFRDCPAV